jgi:sugar/nucleoside kinase (ribokinase family)
MARAIGSMGELLVEFVCLKEGTHHIAPATYEGPFPSGAPAIFIDQAARVGASTIFLGAVGADAFGAVLKHRFAAVGVNTDLVATIADVPTGSAFVGYNEDGSRDFVFNIAHSAAARFPTGPDVVARLIAAGLGAFHISGSTLGNSEMARAALDICRSLHAAGVAISFDPNIRKELMGDPGYMDVVRALTGLARYFLPSAEDAEVLFPGESFESFAPRLRAAGAEHVVLKRGGLGAMALAPDGSLLSLPAHKVEVIDPTGAGDCFCGTFVALVNSGRSVEDALRLANAAGALAVTRRGPMEGNSTLAEISAFLGSAA